MQNLICTTFQTVTPPRPSWLYRHFRPSTSQIQC